MRAVCDLRAGRGHLRRRGSLESQGVVELHARHQVLIREFAIAIGGDLGVGGGGFGLFESGVGLRQRSAIGRRVDEHEGIALLDHAPLLIYALLQYSRNARAHVRCARGRKPTGSFAHQRYRRAMYDDDADFRRWRLLLGRGLAAGCDKQGGNSRANQLYA